MIFLENLKLVYQINRVVKKREGKFGFLTIWQNSNEKLILPFFVYWNSFCSKFLLELLEQFRPPKLKHFSLDLIFGLRLLI